MKYKPRSKTFCVYVYLDPRKQGVFRYNNYNFDYEPFYVGKGQYYHYRHKAHLNEAYSYKDDNTLKCRKIRSIKRKSGKDPIVLIYKKDIVNEKEAFALEISLIKSVGRITLKTGPLTNFTDGGEGSLNLSEESRDKIRKSKTGVNNPFYGKHHTEAVKRRIREANLGNQHGIGFKPSKAHIAKIKKINSERIFSDKERESISNRVKKLYASGILNNKGENNGRYGKKASQKTLERQRSSMLLAYAEGRIKPRCGKDNPMYGKKMVVSDETRKKLSIAMKLAYKEGRKTPIKRKRV